MKMNLSLEKKVRKNKLVYYEDKRKKRVRYKLKKVSSRKRLTVFRSNKHLYAQVIDDSVGKTLS